MERSHKIEDIAAGMVMIIAGVVGTIVNLAVICLIIRTPLFHNAFGYICFSNLAASTAVLLISIFWTGPLTFFNLDESISETFIGSRFGQLTHFFWFESVYCHLQIAINRMVAVVWPFAYNCLKDTPGIIQKSMPLFFNSLNYHFDSSSTSSYNIGSIHNSLC